MKRYFTLMCLLLSCCMAFSGLVLVRPTAQTVYADTGRILVLDAGHGGIDGGAQGVTGLLEKDVNLSVVQKCALLCGLFGIKTILTREQDASIDDGSGKTIAARKAQDIRLRTQIANESGGILVSVHMNFFPEGKYSGAQCFYSKKNPESENLGKSIQNTLSLLDPENKRQAKPADAGIYLMEHVTVPAVIVECGFLSNPREEMLLASDSYRKDLAVAICSGITAFYQNLT